MRRAGVSYRRKLSVVATAAALIAGFVAVTAVSGGKPGTRGADIAAPATVAPLKEAPALSAVPFDRTEDYVILKVDAARADEVGAELKAAIGSQPSVVGITKSATTYVVPASAAAKLSATSGITAVADTPIKMTAQQNPVPSWGLDRLDSSSLDNSYSYISEGSGAYVYVIDTGIYGSNSDFGGRVVSGYTAVADGNGTTDCNGHGTHVAGTVAGHRKPSRRCGRDQPQPRRCSELRCRPGSG
jgi:subtilisin family serine protease